MSAFIDPSLFPESLHPRLASISALYERAQWHQLTLELIAFLKEPAACTSGDCLLTVGAPERRAAGHHAPPPHPH